MKISQFLLLFAILASRFVGAADRPNILWITTEDNAAHWLGCYGNQQAKTPNLDALAEKSTLFTKAYSNAPVCAVARATILMGRYSPSMGTQHMRSRHAIPSDLKTYVHHLRKAGYYCTNASKTDYNFAGNDKSHWDECSGKAHYKNRPEGSPFFAIFNLTTSHESSLFPPKFERSRKSGFVPGKTRLDPATLKLPGHLPDLPEVRRDVARYHDILTGTDKTIGGILAKLKEDGLADDTIIFYYGDHGGPTPRGKRYLHDTGVRIPMIVHVPQKWQHLSPFKPGQKSDEIVAFVDLAPTVLSLAGINPDPNMQGRAFLGKNREEPDQESYAFLYADRFDEIYGFRRGLRDEKFKYVRHFTPYVWAAPYSFYQFQMPSWVAWQKAWQSGKLQGVQALLWENDQPVEELYLIEADPWELKNLADDPKYASHLETMRKALKEQMARVHDTALVPEPLFAKVAGDRPIATAVSDKKFPYQKVLDLAFLASDRDSKNLPELEKAASSSDPVIRYWAISGMSTLGKEAKPSASTLTVALKDPFPILRAQAAHALYRIGQKDLALESLAKEITNPDRTVTEQGFIANIYMQLRETKAIPKSWIKQAAKADPKVQPRLSTLVEKMELLE